MSRVPQTCVLGLTASACVFQAAPAAAAAARAAANDVWDMMEPEEILSKLAKKESADKPTFYVGAVSEKWKGAYAFAHSWAARATLWCSDL
jgi:hypothetical protein